MPKLNISMKTDSDCDICEICFLEKLFGCLRASFIISLDGFSVSPQKKKKIQEQKMYNCLEMRAFIVFC
jgi:hypothetical protein